MEAINPHFRPQPRQKARAEVLLPGLLAGDRGALSQALSLVESRLPAHRLEAEKLVQGALPHSGNSLRVGITGVPGVGKSTFIERFGLLLIEGGAQLAVLAIDPSSVKNRGSILGDKTRMEKLSQHPKAFIRPSPSGGSLGGVARQTREMILLCEAAGYDRILVETVGVGQSETAVKGMVDFFMLLMLAGAGDELQGIKRGIMEMADALIINKADEVGQAAVRLAQGAYQRALHLFPPAANEWTPRVLNASGLQGQGLPQIIQLLEEFERHQKAKGYFASRRRDQASAWFQEALSDIILDRIRSQPAYAQKFEHYRQAVAAGEQEPGRAAREMIEQLLG